MTELTIAEIADYIRKKYPNAVRVNLIVGFHTVSISVDDVVLNDDCFTIRKLNGEWIEKV